MSRMETEGAKATLPVGSDEQDRSAVKSLRKALDILQAVAEAERPPTVAEVALRTGLARATAHRMVQTLIGEGHLEQEPGDGRLSIGYSVLPLAASLLDRNRVRLNALPRLETLARETQQRSNLGNPASGPPALPRGRREADLADDLLALWADGTGPLLLTRQGDLSLSAGGRGRSDHFRPAAGGRNRAYDHDLAGAAQRARGDAGARLRNRPAGTSLGTFCLAAPIFDGRRRPIGAIGVSGQALDPLMACVSTVQHAAEVLSHLS